MKKAMFVCSGGGHLIELLEVLEAFENYKKILVVYKGNEDIAKGIFDAVFVVEPPYGIMSIVRLFFKTIKILFTQRPDYLVSSGSEITIPFFYIGKLLGVKLIYLEGVAQVYSPSITGKIVNPICDLFLVQWKTLENKYLCKSLYRGGLL